MAMGKCGAFAELLDMAARVAVRSYAHLPQTSRAYYKPPTTMTSTTTTATTTSNGGASGRSFDREVEASSARRNQQQHVAAVRVAFDATEIILVGGV